MFQKLRAMSMLKLDSDSHTTQRNKNYVMDMVDELIDLLHFQCTQRRVGDKYNKNMEIVKMKY